MATKQKPVGFLEGKCACVSMCGKHYTVEFLVPGERALYEELGNGERTLIVSELMRGERSSSRLRLETAAEKELRTYWEDVLMNEMCPPKKARKK